MPYIRDLIPGQRFTALKNTASGLVKNTYVVQKAGNFILGECFDVSTGKVVTFSPDIFVNLEPSTHYLFQLKPNTTFSFKDSVVKCCMIQCDYQYAVVFIPDIGKVMVNRHNLAVLGLNYDDFPRG